MQQLKSILGASDTQFNHARPNKPQLSTFPLSRTANLTADAGQIIPFDWFETVPGDIIRMSNVFSLDTLPLVQSSLTGYKVLIHVYYMKKCHLWKGGKTQTTKGRSGNISLPTPRLDCTLPLGTMKYKPYTDSNTEYDFEVLPAGKHSLIDFLGNPSEVSGLYKGLSSGSSANNFFIDKAFLPYTLRAPDNFNENYNKATQTGFHKLKYINALLPMMYQSIVKYNYTSQNLLQENKALFPDEGDDDWLIPYNADIVNFVGESDNSRASEFKYSPDGVYHSDDTAVRLDQLRYSLFDDDYFTTGLPWLQRGDVKTLNLDVSDSDFSIDASGAVGASSSSWYDVVVDSNSKFDLKGDVSSSVLTKALQKLKVNVSQIRTDLTANALRELIAMSVWQERNARVDGSYNNMIFQHWGVNPNSEEHKPIYIGGTAAYVSFNTIIQNSQSTDGSPLGSTAGMGAMKGNGEITSHFVCPDYGYVMCILQIKPDTYYQQGVEHALCCENSFEDLPFPEFQDLSPEPILNKELYVSDDDADNDDLFAYQERMMYLKVRMNVNRGLFQCKPDKDRLFGSFTQARWFNERPSLSYQFLCMSPENMRRDFLAFPSYPAFRLQINTSLSVTRRLAWMSEPNTFGF